MPPEDERGQRRHVPTTGARPATSATETDSRSVARQPVTNRPDLSHRRATIELVLQPQF